MVTVSNHAHLFVSIWSDYDEEAEQAVQAPAEEDAGALKTEYQDVIISDIRVGPTGLNFSVQILNTEGLRPSPTLYSPTD